MVKLVVFFLENDARHADDVRRGVSVRVFTNIALHNVNSLKIVAVLADNIHRGGGNVLRKGVGRVVVISHSLHFVPNTRHPAEVAVAHVLKPIALLQAEHNILDGGEFRKVKPFAKARLRRFAAGVFPWCLFGDGQVVYPVLAVFLKND